jgi:hypothetical protein
VNKPVKFLLVFSLFVAWKTLKQSNFFAVNNENLRVRDHRFIAGHIGHPSVPSVPSVPEDGKLRMVVGRPK